MGSPNDDSDAAWRAYGAHAMLEAITRLPDGAQIVASIPEVTRRAANESAPKEWLSTRHVEAIVTAVAAGRTDDASLEAAMVALGEAMAARATGQFLRLIMRMLTPRLLVRRLPDFWKHDIRGATLVVEDLGDDAMRARVLGCSVPYVGTMCAGFVGFVLRAMGCREVSVEAPLPDLSKARMADYPFVVRWSNA